MKAYRESIFGTYEDQDVLAYTFENDHGCRLKVMNYGATVLEFVTPDKNQQFANIVLGFEDFAAYPGNSPKYGASIGPVAGRIGGASFELEGQTYQLEANNGANCNHSGSSGWDGTLFELEEISNQGLVFYTERPDGSGGFPGHLKVWVSYSLTEADELVISYQVWTDRDSLVNPTNHSYFNLSGHFLQPVDDQVLQIQAQGVYPITADGLPAKSPEADLPFVQALRAGARLGQIFAAEDPQIRLVSGLDHPFALDPAAAAAACLYDPVSGRSLTVRTEAPCLVVYSANVVDDQVRLQGQTMIQHNGLALETQALPDAIHSDQAASVILKAGQTLTSTTVYQAGVR